VHRRASKLDAAILRTQARGRARDAVLRRRDVRV